MERQGFIRRILKYLGDIKEKDHGLGNMDEQRRSEPCDGKNLNGLDFPQPFGCKIPTSMS